MTSAWTPLPWDSEFFGFSIGRVDLDLVDPESLTEVEADARSHGVVCLYGSLDPGDGRTALLVQRYGWLFVEAATMFSMRTDEPAIPKPPGFTFRRGTAADLPSMDDLIPKLAAWSRFAVDPRFGNEASLRLQVARIERAANCVNDDFALMVAEDDSGIIAFITRAAHPRPVVDTVGTTAQGSGAARYLIEDARRWAGDRELLGGPTAARNVNTLRYVSHCNYRVKWVRYQYHRWLDED